VFRFAATEAVFAGHFPGAPILPGVFQIEMVRQASERVIGKALDIRHINSVRFTSPLFPEDEIHLSLTVRSNQDAWDAKGVLSTDGKTAGKLSVVLEPFSCREPHAVRPYTGV